MHMQRENPFGVSLDVQACPSHSPGLRPSGALGGRSRPLAGPAADALPFQSAQTR